MHLRGLFLIVIAGTTIATSHAATVQFAEPFPTTRYRVADQAKGSQPKWVTATPENDPSNPVEIGARIVLQLSDTNALDNILAKRPLEVARQVNDTVVILQAPDALTAIDQAAEISNLPVVEVCHPIMKRSAALDGSYAPMPADRYFASRQWYFDKRLEASGVRVNADLNIRSAWPYSRGEGVTIAIADSGFELDHPELAAPASNGPHFNFATGQPNGAPPTSGAIHGTAVAGLAAAANNGIGLVGAAPEARLASWVVFSGTLLVDDEALMDMFQYQSNTVAVQNHSWGPNSRSFQGFGLLPGIGISNAIEHGRNGLGTIIVRSGGNERLSGDNANDSTYRSDPRFISVAATGFNGRAAHYSNPGACLLVAAVGAEPRNNEGIFTTDRQGSLGYNFVRTFDDDDYWNYAGNFNGTSASAPQIAGIAALILGTNPNLSYRDVQQILIHSARHFDLADPMLATNGAGFVVSHNVGFGIPDAGEAVRLASQWQNRPALSKVRVGLTNSLPIPDAGLRVHLFGENLPGELTSVIASPSRGLHPDEPTLQLPVVDVGTANSEIEMDLTGKAALILRNTNSFAAKINNAAQAGASFAIIYNSSTNPVFAMAETEYVNIPAVFIPQTEGELLRDFVATNSAEAKLQLLSATATLDVNDTLLCEHVGLRVKANHPWRGDLRITLTSPSGTRSILQHLNTDTNVFTNSWTYYSTHHFYESSAGTWTVAVTDEFADGTGSIEELELIIYGTPITDSDADGLDDNWEITHFNSLTALPTDDPDQDGYNNAREQILGTNPLEPNLPLLISLAQWDASHFRASWPANPHFDYQVWAGTNVANLSLLTTISGGFPEAECIVPGTNGMLFMRIVALQTLHR